MMIKGCFDTVGGQPGVDHMAIVPFRDCFSLDFTIDREGKSNATDNTDKKKNNLLFVGYHRSLINEKSARQSVALNPEGRPHRAGLKILPTCLECV